MTGDGIEAGQVELLLFRRFLQRVIIPALRCFGLEHGRAHAGMRLAGHDITSAASSKQFLQALAHPAREEIGGGMAVTQLQDGQAMGGKQVAMRQHALDAESRAAAVAGHKRRGDCWQVAVRAGAEILRRTEARAVKQRGQALAVLGRRRGDRRRDRGGCDRRRGRQRCLRRENQFGPLLRRQSLGGACCRFAQRAQNARRQDKANARRDDQQGNCPCHRPFQLPQKLLPCYFAHSLKISRPRSFRLSMMAGKK